MLNMLDPRFTRLISWKAQGADEPSSNILELSSLFKTRSSGLYKAYIVNSLTILANRSSLPLPILSQANDVYHNYKLKLLVPISPEINEVYLYPVPVINHVSSPARQVL